MKESTIHGQRVMKLVLVMAAVLAGSWLVTMAVAPTDLAAAQQDCDKCHVYDDPFCPTCHQDEPTAGQIWEDYLDQLEFDAKMQCVFLPWGEPCAEVTTNTCSKVQLAWSVITGHVEECQSIKQFWTWM